MATTQDLREQARLLPEKPGVYQFYSAGGENIYVGKARNLKKRVASYFGRNQAGKTRVMVGKIREIRHIVVDNESEALLLENNLIKRNQPRYNVLMKDDKTFPWISIKKEPFPRVFLTRTFIDDGSDYYGPYTSVVMARTILLLIRQLYTIRTCSYNLSKEKIESSRYKVCLEYHLGNCLAPCIGRQEEEEYQRSISQIREILKGNIHNVTRHLKDLMKRHSDELKFEEAHVIKVKLEILDKYRSRSTVVNPKIKDVDVFGFSEEGEQLFVNFLRIIRGAVVQTYTLEFKRRIEESADDIMALAITEFRKRHNSESKEIIVSFIPEIQEDNVKYTVPRQGDKLKLLELAQRNAVYYRLNLKKRMATHKPTDKSRLYLERMQKDLHLPELPVYIECFDNSNIQGSNPVAACVVFRNGRPYKKDYRHFHIKSVSGANDFSSMEEVVFRRYRRLMDEGGSLPQLIIVDGGKGQLSSAVKSLDTLGIRGKVSIIGIAKRLEEIYFPGDPVPIYIDKNSMTLKIIQNLRNEAHRFGINFHRDQRSRSMLESVLDEIPGIGSKSKEQLLNKFGTIDEIEKLSAGELKIVIGEARAQKIVEYFKNHS